MKKLILFSSIFLATFLTGCVTSFQYGAKELATVKSVPQATTQPCYVEPFTDNRGNPKNKNTVFQTWIPLVPYGEKESFYPEQGNMYIFVSSYYAQVANALTNACILSLNKAGVFSSVSATPTPRAPSGYTLSGSVYNFSIHEYYTTYCISFFGSIPPIIGLPCGSSTNRIGLELTLKDNTSNKIIWRSRLYDEEKMLLGYYYNSTRELGAFPEIYARLMNQAAEQIAEAIKKHESAKKR